MSEEQNSALLRAIDDAVASVQRGTAAEGLTEALNGIRRKAAATERALAEAQREGRALSTLYVVSMRLFQDPEVSKVSDAIAESVINFLGSEDFALFLKQDRGFVRIRGQGPAGDLDSPLTAKSPLWPVTQQQDATFSLKDWVAVTPLLGHRGTPIGLLAVRRLLPQKPRLGFEDRELVSLLRTRAGIALELAGEHEGAH